MLKPQPITKKQRAFLAGEQSNGTGNFRAGSVKISSRERIRETCSEVTKIAGIPEEGEQYHIVTQKSINSFDFILSVLDQEQILNLYLAFYRIGKRVTAELIRLHKAGDIKNLVFVINDGLPRLLPDVYALISGNQSPKWRIITCHNHTKIILMGTDQGNYYTVEGSGNLSVNARIEQYIFINYQPVYDFHRDWMENL